MQKTGRYDLQIGTFDVPADFAANRAGAIVPPPNRKRLNSQTGNIKEAAFTAASKMRAGRQPWAAIVQITGSEDRRLPF